MSARAPGWIVVDRGEMRMRLIEMRAKLRQAVEGQRLAEHAGKRAQDRPVLARVAGREGGAVGDLHAPLGVHVSA